MDEADLRKQAKKRLEAKAEFRNYLWIWLGVSVIVVVIWAVTNFGGYFWPAWPIAGMGIGAFFIGLNAYGPSSRGFTDSQIDAEVNRMKDKG